MSNTVSLADQNRSMQVTLEREEQKPEPSLVDWKNIWKPLSLLIGAFLLFFFLPMDSQRFTNSVFEALALAKWYAREHVLLCLVPAFFIAGAISVFVSQAAVVKYLGAGAHKVLSYGVASVSGSILAVCSCTVLPLFAGIWKRGAGLGPAIAFLYSGPAINVLAIILTARILGPELGIGRAVGAVLFSVVIGLIMHVMFREEEQAKAETAMYMPEPEVDRPLWQNIIYFATMVLLLVAATWSGSSKSGFWHAIYSVKWLLTGLFAIILGVQLVAWFRVKAAKVLIAGVCVLTLAIAFPHEPPVAFSAGIVALVILLTTTRGETESWFLATWDFAKQITPLLLAGVLAAGLCHHLLNYHQGSARAVFLLMGILSFLTVMLGGYVREASRPRFVSPSGKSIAGQNRISHYDKVFRPEERQQQGGMRMVLERPEGIPERSGIPHRPGLPTVADVISERCVGCHTLYRVQKYKGKHWHRVVKRMQAYGTKISNEEVDKIARHLEAGKEY